MLSTFASRGIRTRIPLINFLGKRLPNDKSKGVNSPAVGADGTPLVTFVQSENELPERFRRKPILETEANAIDSGIYQIPF